MTDLEMLIPEEGAWGVLAKKVAPQLKEGVWLRLVGELGAGKTSFVRSLLAFWGYTDTVASPSFPLLIEYPFEDVVVYHLDAFRLEPKLLKSPSSSSLSSQWDLEAWKKGVLLAEWPENAGLDARLFHFELEIQILKSGRRAIWKARQ